MKPMTPVIPRRSDLPEIIFAKDQPEYIPLPAYRDSNGVVVTRWRLSFWERLRILLYGDLWLTLLTFNRPLQPIRLEVIAPELEAAK